MGNTFKSILVRVALGIGLMAAFNALDGKKEDNGQIEYSQFIQQVNNGEVSGVNIEGSVVSGYLIKGERTDKSTFFTNAPLDDNLIKTLLDKNVRVKVTPEEKPGALAALFYSLLPVLLLIGAWFYFMRMQTGGGGKGGAFSFGKSRARLLDKDANKVTFADVAYCDEAKEEVQEIVDYLKAPNRYQSLGGRVPRGILLAGSPVRVRRFWRKRLQAKPACRSSAFQVPTLSKCSSVSVQAASAICSSRRRKTPPASSLSTRLTQSAANAAQVWAAAMMSASKH